jgi:hypothetical protein
MRVALFCGRVVSRGRGSKKVDGHDMRTVMDMQAGRPCEATKSDLTKKQF